MALRSLLNRMNRPGKRGTKLQLDRKMSDESLLLRFAHHILYIDIEEFPELTGLPLEEARKLYYGFKNKTSPETLDKLCDLFHIDRHILLSYAYDWKKNNGTLSRDLPFPMLLTGSDGQLTSERVWFQNSWYEENFKHEDNTTVMRISDHSLAPFGFNRGDIVIASRLPEHVLFKNHHIYMVREKDGSINPRVAEVISIGSTSDYTRVLCNTLDKNDKIVFSPLPEGYEMIGRLVWKSCML